MSSLQINTTKMDSKSRLAYLLKRRHEKTITRQEEEELFRRLSESSDADLTEFLHSEWEKAQDDTVFFKGEDSARMLTNILQAGDRTNQQTARRGKHIVLRRLAAAAAMLIFLSAGFYAAFHNPTEPQPEIAASTPELSADAPPGGNKATLTLSQGKTIVLDNASNGLLAHQGAIAVNKTKDGQLVYEVTSETEHQANGWNTLTTPRGGQYQLILPDGSKVWLNAASSLKFPTAFTGETRLVELTGEAYFEVASNAAMPFMVKSDNAEIEVLGTHFNIMAYREEGQMKTTLLEGSVKVSSGGFTNILTPGQQAALTANGEMAVTDNVNVHEAVAWKNGLFEFNEADLPSVMREAARWYDLEVSYEGEIPQRRFTGRISRNVNASELLSILKYTGVNFRIQDKKIIVTS